MHVVILRSPARNMPRTATCGFRIPLPLRLLRAGATAEFQGKRFGDTALMTRLAFGDGKGLRQFGDSPLLYALVFPVLLADFRQFATRGFQIHACLVHLRMRSVFDRLDVLLPTVPFLGRSCFDRLDLLPKLGLSGHERLIPGDQALKLLPTGLQLGLETVDQLLLNFRPAGGELRGRDG